MIEAVLFDIDGTLLDHAAASAASLRQAVARELGGAGLATLDHEAIDREWRRLEELHYAEYLSGEIDIHEQRRRRAGGVLRHLGSEERGPADLNEWFAAFLVGYREGWALFDDVLPTLDGLEARGLRLGVITNADGALQRAKLEGVGIAERLPTVVASSDVGTPKPEPGIFAEAAALVGLPAERVLYVGDRLDTDARGARDAGMLGVWIDRAGLGEAEDVPVIGSLVELADLIE